MHVKRSQKLVFEAIILYLCKNQTLVGACFPARTFIHNLIFKKSMKYTIQTLKNSAGTNADRKYVHVMDLPPMSEKQLTEHIQHTCSLTRGDVKAALSAIADLMKEELSEGRRFHIPEVGYFSLAVDTHLPADRPIEKIKGDHIYVRNIKFRPEAAMLKDVQRRTKFSKSKHKTASCDYTDEEVVALVRKYLADNKFLTRRALQSVLSTNESSALRWLRRLVELGVIENKGTRYAPAYFLV